MHTGAWIWISAWAVSGLPSRGVCVLLSYKPSHMALSQTFFAEGWMSLSGSPGSPHSHTHTRGPGGEITLRTRAAEWTAGQLWPQPHQFLHHFLGNYVGGRPDHNFFPLSLTKAVFSVVLLSFTWALPSYSLLFGTNLHPRVPCFINFRVPKTSLSHPFLLFWVHFVIIDLEHIWSLFQTESF